MTLAVGTRLGGYDVLALIGAGGMGEVYRARDTRLQRDVAIKILPDLFAHDPERLARFKREAQVLGSLNHPHIAAIYGLEDTDGVCALVLELVEGPTLAEILARSEDRALPLSGVGAEEGNGAISPDGRWLAYQSNDSGQFEIDVRPFPDVNAGHWQISTSGGVQPLWARNSQELFYLTPAGALMDVQIGRGTEWTAGLPAKLFQIPYIPGINTRAAPTYDVSPDGRRFLMIKQAGEPGQTAMSPSLVVQNWFEELQRLVPTK